MNNNKLKPVLGRGLDALIRSSSSSNEESTIIKNEELAVDDGKKEDIISKIPVDLIHPNPFQPRINFDPSALDDLKRSILANGLIQPITVRRYNDQYQLISGERRYKACCDIGFKEIPAYIIKVETDEAMLAMALIENLQREQLNPIEVGLAYKRLADECNLTQEQISEKVGKDRSTIANFIRLLKLPKEIQEALIKEEISSGHARALINLPNEPMQLSALHKIKEGSLSVRKVEQLVKKMLLGDQKPRIAAVKPSGIVQAGGVREVEDKLRRIFGTKVVCKQKNDGTGEIILEFYSNDELDRLFELFDVIEKNYS